MLPVHMAALHGYLVCLKKLTGDKDSADIDNPDDMGRTCLHAAACGG